MGDRAFRARLGSVMTSATVEQEVLDLEARYRFRFADARTSARTKFFAKAFRYVAIMATIVAVQGGVVVAVLQYRDALAHMGALAYLGVMLAEFANSAMIFLPTPLPAYTLAVSLVLNPLLVGVLGGLSAASGEMVGYYLGCRGRAVVGEGRTYRRLAGIAHRYGDRAIFLVAVLPVPFDIAGIWAGTVRYPMRRFFAAVAAAKMIRITAAAAASHYGIDLLINRLG